MYEYNCLSLIYRNYNPRNIEHKHNVQLQSNKLLLFVINKMLIINLFYQFLLVQYT